MLRWAEQIKQSTTEQQIQLHIERFALWRQFIDDYAKTNQLEVVVIPQIPRETNKFGLAVVKGKTTFSLITLFHESGQVAIFDNSFGSLDATSDLDVTVISKDVNVITAWILYLEGQHANMTGTLTWTEIYDSNFYFEPGTLQNDGTLTSLIGACLHELRPGPENMMELATLVQDYATAYSNKQCLTLPGQGKERRLVYPNPESPGFTHTTEIEQYQNMAFYAHQLMNNDLTALSVARYACTKTEGLLCVGSLAICGVFGLDIQQQFINDQHQPWRLVSALEMLLNMKMHEQDGRIKTKYLSRLNSVLVHGPNACQNNLRKAVSAKIEIEKAQKSVQFPEVSSLISFIIEDEHNKEACLQSEIVGQSLDDDITQIQDMITTYSTTHRKPMFRTHVSIRWNK
jgi:hypothetical protein